MNVLMLTPYVTISERPEFSKNKTGFGYMVFDIARAVAQTENVDVLASDSRGKEFEIDKVRFLKRSFGLFLRNVFKCLSLKAVWKLKKQYTISSSTLLRQIYYWFISGYYCNVIKDGNYDIVHIHGCGFATDLWMQVCKKCDQKFVVTLHGLNSFSDTVRIEPAAKQYERDFLKRVVDREFPITVISTGMKRIIEKTYEVSDCNNITVVCNSFSFNGITPNMGGG